MDRQCSSCGGFCKKSGCERENVKTPQPEQEPVAWANPHDLQNFDMKVRTSGGPLHTVPLYTTPPQRKPLDEREREWIVATCPTPRHIIKAVEAAHGIKE